jgi:hypothetical protein
VKTVKEIIKGKLSESDRDIIESTFKGLLGVKTDMRSSLTEIIADEASSEAKKKAEVALKDDINGGIKAVCSEVSNVNLRISYYGFKFQLRFQCTEIQ